MTIQPLRTGLLDWPVRGRIPCGPGEPLWDESDGTPIRYLLSDKPNQLELFECVGDSMSGARLKRGDVVVVDCSKYPQPGDIAAIRTATGEYMLKRMTIHGAASERRPKVLEEVVLSTEAFAFGKVVRVVKNIDDLTW